MERIFVGAVSTPRGKIEYYLIKELCAEHGIVYGITVILEKETAEITQITTQLHKIQELLHAMLRGSVTPVTVRDIVEDWLAQ